LSKLAEELSAVGGRSFVKETV